MASDSVNVAEKPTTIVTTTETTSDLREANEEAVILPERNFRRAVWTIFWGVALPCIPITIVTAVLLYVVFKYQLKLNPGWKELQLAGAAESHNVTSLIRLIRHEGGKAAYFVQYNPSTITTIASWTSRVIPYLSSSIMALVAFFAARHIVLESKRGDGSNLPDPHQLTLLISILGGSSFGPLIDTVMYRLGKKGRLIHPLPAACSALAVITVLGIIIPLVDTWFGIATKADTVTQLYPRKPVFTKGRGLSCAGGPRANATENNLVDPNAFWPCNVVIPGVHPFAFVGGLAEASKISQGISTVHQVRNYTDTANATFYYLGDAAQNSSIDYRARTFAISSTCAPMTQQCGVTFETHGTGASKRFSCSQAFTGNVNVPDLNASAIDMSPDLTQRVPNIGMAFAGDAALKQAGGTLEVKGSGGLHSTSGTVNQIYNTNPLHYGAWAYGYPAPGATFEQSDTGIVFDYTWGGIWLLNCSTTVYEATYTWVDGAVRTFNVTKASDDMAGLLGGPFALQDLYTSASLATVASIAGNGNNSREISQIFSREFSRIMLAYSNSAMEPITNELEQARNAGIAVARVPMVPLYLLLGTKALYVLAVIVLAVGAYCFTHPAETEVVKAQLSVRGLAAAHFDQPDLMQQNVVKELQNRIDAAKSNGPNAESKEKGENDNVEGSSEQPGVKRAATAPVNGTAPPKETKVGLLPGADGSWRFVTVANGVWTSIKPIVENLVVTDAKAGGMGGVGEVISAWK